MIVSCTYLQTGVQEQEDALDIMKCFRMMRPKININLTSKKIIKDLKARP